MDIYKIIILLALLILAGCSSRIVNLNCTNELCDNNLTDTPTNTQINQSIEPVPVKLNESNEIKEQPIQPEPQKQNLVGVTSLSGFPESFFEESLVSKENLIKGLDAQYLALKEMHNGISPYAKLRVEYEPEVYGSTMSDGLKIGDSASPKLNSGNPRWEVMAHEQGHNFLGGTSGFYGSLAFPKPFLQESLAVLSAFYTYHYILENQAFLGIDQSIINSMDVDFTNGRAYQESMYERYVSTGKKFDIDDVLTSQALDYMMITYGETYGWNNYKKLAKAFQNNISVYFTFQKDGASAVEQSTYIVAALSAAFDRDFRTDFTNLNFPIDDNMYNEVYPKIKKYLE